MLAIARAAGETAPLLFTIFGAQRVLQTNLFHGTNTTLSVVIWQNAQQPFAAAQDRAWGAGLTLIALVFLCTMIARFVSARFSTLES
jgi:phosphate transport system permease protein